ncbi:MAG TPA: hypothetical protein VJB68_00150, partial [Methylophilaceae bacterium]|nr:hypothetical protein [Methylophilaceae bacterium]
MSEQDKTDFKQISDLLGREGRALSVNEVATKLGLQVKIEGKQELDVGRAERLLLVGAGRRGDFARKFVTGTPYFSINQTPRAGVIFQGQREYSHSDPVRRFLAALSDNPAGQTLEELVKLTGVPKARAQEILRDETRETEDNKGFFRAASVVRQIGRNKTVYFLQEKLKPEEQIELLTARDLLALSKNEDFVRLTGIFANAIASLNFISAEDATVFAQRVAYAYYITQKHEAHAWQKARPIRDEVEERLWMTQHKGDPRDSLEAILRNMLKRHEEHAESNVVLPDNIFSTEEREAGYSNLANLANNLKLEFNLRDGREWRYHATVLDMARVLAAQTQEGAAQAILNLPKYMVALECVVSNRAGQADPIILKQLIRIGLVARESPLDSSSEMQGTTADGHAVDAADYYPTKYLVSPKVLLHSRSLAGQARHDARPGETLIELLARHNFQTAGLS